MFSLTGKELDLGGYAVRQPDPKGMPRTVGYAFVEAKNLEHWVLITRIADGDDPHDELMVWRKPHKELCPLTAEPDPEAIYQDVEDFLARHRDPYPGRREYHRHEVTIEF